MKRVDDPSIIDFLAEAPLPEAMARDLRIAQRSSQIAARRKHGRPVDTLLVELDRLVAESEATDGLAVTAAAFWEARAAARTSPARAMRYTRQAAILRPGATGVGGEPFPASVDATWRTLLELTASGVASDAELDLWLDVVDAVPGHARHSYLGDQMNVVTVANRFWLDESTLPVADRNWSKIHHTLERLEAWSTERTHTLLFAAARRARIVVRGEYEHDLTGATQLATRVHSFPRILTRCFCSNEIAASQFLYAGQYPESVVAFRGALTVRPDDSSILATTFLKAAQAAAAADSSGEAVTWAREGVEATRTNPYRTSTDGVVARAELALATWFNDDCEAALDLWDDATEELFVIEENTSRWRGLLVRFQWVDGYLESTYRSGTPPTVDAEGRPYGAPRPGSFLIDLAGQAPGYDYTVRFGILLGLASISDQRAHDDAPLDLRRVGSCDRTIPGMEADARAPRSAAAHHR